MEKYIVAIPSYKRADKQESAEYFSLLGIPKERIYIFVQTQEDEEAYQRYKDIATVVYRPAQAVAQARNNILKYFNGAANILMLDDDISCIGRLKAGKIAEITSREELSQTINRCFAFTAKSGAELFGLYPVYNAFFMSPDISTAVTVNTAIGFLKGSSLRFDESYQTKEDIEMCARILATGRKVIRFNFLSMKSRHRSNPGGCHDIWKSGVNRTSAKRLCAKYPDILAPHATREDEVRVLVKDRKVSIGKGAYKDNGI